MNWHRENLAAGENGQSMIETAVSLPVLFLLLFCFMEVCLAFYTKDMISESAREGTQYAMFRSSTCTSYVNGTTGTCEAKDTAVKTYVANLGWPNLAGGSMGTSNVSVVYLTNTGATGGTNTVGDEVQVTVTYAFPIILPFVPKGGLTLSSTSTMTILN